MENARKARKVSIAALAKACDFSPATWHEWRKGNYQPGSETLTRIALFLGTTPNQLLLSDPSGNDTPTAENQASLNEINRLVMALDRSSVRPSAVIEQVCRSLTAAYPPSSV